MKLKALYSIVLLLLLPIFSTAQWTTYFNSELLRELRHDGQFQLHEYDGVKFANPNYTFTFVGDTDGNVWSAPASGNYIATHYDSLINYTGGQPVIRLTQECLKGTWVLAIDNPIVNGGTVVRDGLNRKWVRLFDDIHYKPEWFYDQATDAEKINKIITTFRDSVVIELGCQNNYELDRPIFARNDLRFEGNGSGTTISKQAPWVTTITKPETAGANQITVVDASGYAVGQVLNIFSGTANGQNQPNLLIITDITGNVITFSSGLGVDILSGEVVANCYYMIQRGVADLGTIEIENITFDGNKDAFNQTIAWDKNVGLDLSGSIAKLENVTFVNMPTETMFVDRGTATDCRWENIGGSIIHFTNTFSDARYGFRIDNAFAYNFNQNDNALASHSEALFTWSFKAGNVIVTNSHFELGGEAIFGKISSDDLGVMMISNSIFKDIDGGIMAAYNSGGLTNPVEGFTIDGCRFYDCGTSLIDGTGVGGELSGVKFSDNMLKNTVVNFGVNILGLCNVNNTTY